MALVFCILLVVSIAASIPNINANQNSRSLLQLIFQNETLTTPAPTLYGGDLSSCDDTVTLSFDANETELWISINSVPEQGIVGIDACDYNTGNNDFSFYLLLEGLAYGYVSGASSNPRRCTLTGNGAYLEWTRASYYTDTDYWLHVNIYASWRGDRILRLTRSCEILATTPLPTMSPTTPAPITSAGEIYCNDRVENTLDYGPHFYEFYLSTETRVHFQDCETEFDPNLYVYDMNTMEEVQDSVCDGDDCGNCTSSLREEYTLTLEPGSYYVMIRECCSNDVDTGGLTYVIETRCTAEVTTAEPTTANPTSNPVTQSPTTYEPSRSPLFWNETHPPTTTNPTRNPVTKRPTRSPVTAAPTASPVTTTTDDVVGGSDAEWYSVRFSVVIMFIGTLFV